MIVADNLGKAYDGFAAVDGVSFSVEEGEIFGIVGPNGAGKTTTLKMLAGLLEPSSGGAEVAGLDISDPEMRRHIGFLPEETPLYENMTPASYLGFFADLYGVPPSVAAERAEDLLDSLDLEHRDRRLGDMSKGMKQKVAIARSLINDPEVLIYDEPTSGLDPVTTKEVHRFVRDLGDGGRSVVFSAHNLFHVEHLSDRVAVMREGRVAAEDTVEGLRDSFGQTQYRVHVTVELPGAEPGDGDYVLVVEDMEGVEAVRSEAESLGGRVADIRTMEQSLEDIFLSIIER
ncbi:MAG: Trehalose/maltose import ATP-binding protein MalK [Methanonatronarchaeales archaeon]|nr:Trehalose/maltose import ATP-binding protein MalK [Methanonatronarchaeales archaeon]